MDTKTPEQLMAETQVELALTKEANAALRHDLNNLKQIVQTVKEVRHATINSERRKLKQAFDMILETADIEEWRCYTGDRVWDPRQNSQPVVLVNMLNLLQEEE